VASGTSLSSLPNTVYESGSTPVVVHASTQSTA
jgi:hypothetical protein